MQTCQKHRKNAISIKTMVTNTYYIFLKKGSTQKVQTRVKTFAKAELLVIIFVFLL